MSTETKQRKIHDSEKHNGMSKRRVVVTGLGALSPLGNNVEASWRGVCSAQSGIAVVDSFDVSEYPSKIAGQVKDFDPSPYLNSKEVRKLDKFVQYAAVAASQALEDAQLSVNESNAHRVGVAIGSGIGGLPFIEKAHNAIITTSPKKISPFFIPGAIINMASGYVSIMHGLKGPNISVVTACTTSAHNIGLAARMIACGDADIMVAGGTEMATCPLGLGGFAAMRALSLRNDAPEQASRPWDKSRDGFVLGDGAGVLILESYESAKQRNAKVYAELVGFGMSGDAYHISAPDENGLGFIASMRNALNDANLSLESIDYINAHGTSTPVGDVIEAKAIKDLFAGHAYNLAISSTKSMTGHLLGAAGAIEAIFSILAIRDSMVPPTINLDEPDDNCDLNFVAHQAQERCVNFALSNSFGFGGTNGTLIFKRMMDEH